MNSPITKFLAVVLTSGIIANSTLAGPPSVTVAQPVEVKVVNPVEVTGTVLALNETVRTPFHVTASEGFVNGATSNATIGFVPAGSRLTLTTISVLVHVPAGQRASARVYGAPGNLAIEVPLQLQGTFSGMDTYCGTEKVELTMNDGITAVYGDIVRNSTAGGANCTVTMFGYLESITP